MKTLYFSLVGNILLCVSACKNLSATLLLVTRDLHLFMLLDLFAIYSPEYSSHKMFLSVL